MSSDDELEIIRKGYLSSAREQGYSDYLSTAVITKDASDRVFNSTVAFLLDAKSVANCHSSLPPIALDGQDPGSTLSCSVSSSSFSSSSGIPSRLPADAAPRTVVPGLDLNLQLSDLQLGTAGGRFSPGLADASVTRPDATSTTGVEPSAALGPPSGRNRSSSSPIALCIAPHHQALCPPVNGHPRGVAIGDMSSGGVCVRCDIWGWCRALADTSTWYYSAHNIDKREERRVLAEGETESEEESETQSNNMERYSWRPEELDTLPRNAFFSGQMVPRLNRPPPEELFPAVLSFLQDGTPLNSSWASLPSSLIDQPFDTPPKAFHHFKAALSLLSESPDLMHQVYSTQHGQPFHLPGECEVVPWWYNRFKGSCYALVANGVLLQLFLRQGGADDRIIDEAGVVCDLAQPVQTAYKQASSSKSGFTGNLQRILRLRKNLDKAFSPPSPPSSSVLDGFDLSPAPHVRPNASEAVANFAPVESVSQSKIDLLKLEMRSWLPSLRVLVQAMEEEFGKKVPRNRDNVPTIWWSRSSSTDSVITISVLAFLRCTVVCDRNQPHRSSTSPGTVYLMWVRSYLQNGPRDAATGCRLDFSLETHSWRGPTLVAHVIHRSRFHMGWATPWPTSPAEFNPATVNARVELRILNFGIGSCRYSALNVCFETALRMVTALRDRLGAHGLCLDFAGDLTPRLPEEYTFNGVEDIERPLLNAELGLDLDVRQGKLRVTMHSLNALAVDVDAWNDDLLERHVGNDFVAVDALLSLGVDDVEKNLSWLYDEEVVRRITDTVRTHQGICPPGFLASPTQEQLRALSKLPRNLYNIIRFHTGTDELKQRRKEVDKVQNDRKKAENEARKLQEQNSQQRSQQTPRLFPPGVIMPPKTLSPLDSLTTTSSSGSSRAPGWSAAPNPGGSTSARPLTSAAASSSSGSASVPAWATPSSFDGFDSAAASSSAGYSSGSAPHWTMAPPSSDRAASRGPRWATAPSSEEPDVLISPPPKKNKGKGRSQPDWP